MAMDNLNIRVERLRDFVRGQFDGLSKWQLALLFGTPITLGLAGYVYYNKNRKHKKKSDGKGHNKTASSPKTAATANLKNKLVNEDQVTPLDKAIEAKKKGNHLFKAGKYSDAIECYTEAISLCPSDKVDELATFYQNRAAAYGQLNNHKQVISDCSEALRLNPKYAKALNRRAKAAEREGELKLALEDLTFLCMLENFGNEETVKFSEQVLRNLGKQKAKIELASRKPTLPSKTFMSVFREMFRNDPIFNIDTSKLEQGSAFTKACEEFLEDKCENLIDLCNEELNLATSTYLTEALLLRGTTHLYMGAFSDAIKDFDILISQPNIDNNFKVNALIKKSNCYGQQSLSSEAMDCYAQAVNVDPENVDIYFHRGQQLMFQDRCDESVEDYKKCIEIAPDFPQAHVYKCLADHRTALINNSAEGLEKVAVHFGEVVNKFPNCIEARIKFGQTLLGQGKPDKAREHFEKVLELDPNNAMATVYMGVLLLNYKPDFDQIHSYIDKAIKMDDRYEYPYELLASIEVHRGKVESAVMNFQKAIKLARTEHEIAHLFTLMDATQAQVEVTRRLGINMAEAMAASSNPDASND